VESNAAAGGSSILNEFSFSLEFSCVSDIFLKINNLYFIQNVKFSFLNIILNINIINTIGGDKLALES